MLPLYQKALREEVDESVDKWSDISHIKRSLGSQLYNIRPNHKELSEIVITHIKRCFAYALTQNKNDEESLASAVRNIVPHLYGEHGQCENWCGYTKNPETCKHRGLPDGKDLTSLPLKEKLTNIFEVYAASSKKLAPLGSSQRNESYNNIVASKTPK